MRRAGALMFPPALYSLSATPAIQLSYIQCTLRVPCFPAGEAYSCSENRKILTCTFMGRFRIICCKMLQIVFSMHSASRRYCCLVLLAQIHETRSEFNPVEFIG